MKTLVFTALSLLVFAVNANSSTIDAPHNSSNGILCSACHSYSFWWAYSPLNQEYQGYAELVDSVCLNCHDGVAAIGDPCEHSSAAMEEMHNRDLGDWQTKCVDCHDPHFQDQLYWRTDFPTDLYLVTGIIGDNSTITYQNDTTTFDYSVETWMPGWDDPTFWGNKNNTVPGRGLILNVGTTSAENTFQVISALCVISYLLPFSCLQRLMPERISSRLRPMHGR